MDLVELALRERAPVCGIDGLPVPMWPFYAETMTQTIVIGGTSSEFVFEAERDTTFTDLSISVTQTDTPDTEIPATVSITYCGVAIAISTNVREFGYCCSRKPIFSVGVPEGKKLKLTVTIPANAEEVTVEVTLSGYQGNGCCN